MSDFVDLQAVITDPSALGDGAVQTLATTFAAQGNPGWKPSDGALEIILLYIIAVWAADCATLAMQTRLAVFRAFGTKLMGLPYNGGASATVTSTWTLADTLGHTIPAGTYVTIGTQGFYVQTDTVVTAGSSTATITLVAVEQGIAYNGLSGPAALNQQIDWVSSVAIVGSTSGGADAETDDAYTARLATELALQAPRPITASDYPPFVQSVPSTILPAGVTVGRATAIDGYNPASATFTVSTTSGSPTLTITTAPATGVYPGASGTITGTGIPNSTTILSANTTTITMSANATATASGITATVGAYTGTGTGIGGGTFGNARTITTFVTDPSGNALSSASMTAIQSWLAGGTVNNVTYLGFREVNFICSIQQASYSLVYVTVSIHALPNQDTGALATAVENALLAYLSPLQWGAPTVTGGSSPGPPAWLNAGFQTLRANKLLNVCESVIGVDYVPAGGLTFGLSSTPVGTADLVLPGPAPLPTSTAASIIVNIV